MCWFCSTRNSLHDQLAVARRLLPVDRRRVMARLEVAQGVEFGAGAAFELDVQAEHWCRARTGASPPRARLRCRARWRTRALQGFGALVPDQAQRAGQRSHSRSSRPSPRRSGVSAKCRAVARPARSAGAARRRPQAAHWLPAPVSTSRRRAAPRRPSCKPARTGARHAELRRGQRRPSAIRRPRPAPHRPRTSSRMTTDQPRPAAHRPGAASPASSASGDAQPPRRSTRPADG